MESLRKLGLLDANGKPLDERLDKALNDLVPRFRRRFPAIQDEVEITEVFEEAAHRIEKRERQSGPDCRPSEPEWHLAGDRHGSLEPRGSFGRRDAVLAARGDVCYPGGADRDRGWRVDSVFAGRLEEA